jgi:hypothetical protein
MPSEILPGASIPEFPQLLFGRLKIDSCCEHPKQSRFPAICDYGQWHGCCETCCSIVTDKDFFGITSISRNGTIFRRRILRVGVET